MIYGNLSLEKESFKLKILLLGEYSGLYKNLKEGLLELGHDVKLGANGDGWKNIKGADFQLYRSKSNKSALKKAINCTLDIYSRSLEIKGYDVVQLVNTLICSPYINLNFIKRLKKNNHKIYLSGAGSDYFDYKAYLDGAYRYYVYDDDKEMSKLYSNYSLKGRMRKKNDIIVSNLVDGVIPIAYEYARAYKCARAYDNNIKLKKTIPIPMNINNITYEGNKVKNKIVIFHGLNRENFKGTRYIRRAMEIIKERYKDEVEIIIDGKMPFDKYLDVMSHSNIIIDQCKSYGYGMNAIYSMAKGKIVMSGAEPETIKELAVENCPIINIRPDVNDIVNKLEMLIKDKQNIEQLGYESRKYVEKHHDYIKVAQKYVEVWSENL